VLQKLGTIIRWIILLPLVVAVLLLAVANDQTVTIHLNPFDPNDPLLKVDLALYAAAFILFALGALLGGFIVWSGQRKYRRRARRQRDETDLWQARAEASGDRNTGERRPQPAAFLPRPERG
jgi:uncharacterized integral membrane protein